MHIFWKGNVTLHAMAEFWEIVVLAAGASFVQRTTGFGFGIFIMTSLPFIMPSYGEATALSGLLAMTTAFVIVFRMRRFISWKRLIPILLTFIVISSGAIFMLSRIQDSTIRSVLGIILIVISLYFAFFKNRINLKTTLPYQIGAGTLSGLMGGFFGMQGPPAVLYFISSEPDKEHYMAMIQTFFLTGNAMMTLVRAINGFVTPTVGMSYLYGLGGLAAGIMAGEIVFRHIPAKIFPYIVYAYIGICGAIILITG